jgi:hypothetical protein
MSRKADTEMAIAVMMPMMASVEAATLLLYAGSRAVGSTFTTVTPMPMAIR